MAGRPIALTFAGIGFAAVFGASGHAPNNPTGERETRALVRCLAIPVAER